MDSKDIAMLKECKIRSEIAKAAAELECRCLFWHPFVAEGSQGHISYGEITEEKINSIKKKVSAVIDVIQGDIIDRAPYYQQYAVFYTWMRRFLAGNTRYYYPVYSLDGVSRDSDVLEEDRFVLSMRIKMKELIKVAAARAVAVKSSTYDSWREALKLMQSGEKADHLKALDIVHDALADLWADVKLWIFTNPTQKSYKLKLPAYMNNKS